MGLLLLDRGARARAVPDSAIPPSHRRVVIVRAGVRDEVAWIVVRFERRRLWIRAKRKLKNRHPREAEALTQGFHGGRDHAEVLRDEWQMLRLQGVGDDIEERRAWPLHPFASHRGGFSGWYFPRRLEAAEVIDA